MKKFFFVLIVLFYSSTSLFAEYKLEPVHCTEKKKSNCGAYLYNTKTGSTYFCDSEKCQEILQALEESGAEEVSEGSKKSKNPKFLKSLKFLKKIKRNQKYQNLRSQNNSFFIRRFLNSYFYC